MEILYLLIPLSAVLVLLVLGVFGWALFRGQFDDLEREGSRVLEHTDTAAPLDERQSVTCTGTEQSLDRDPKGDGV